MRSGMPHGTGTLSSDGMSERAMFDRMEMKK
jgi:hypothetical protein